MRKGKLGNWKLNLVTPNYSEILNQIQQEIQLTAKLTLAKRSAPLLPLAAPPAVAAPAPEKRPPVEPLPPPEVSAKKQRTINISFGFESDSEGD